ncbi:MAG: ABC transporter permease [Bacteroidota bacterium]
MNNAPSNLWLRFFRWYCHPDYVEDLEGDLIERFEKMAQKKGVSLAKWRFTKDVIRLFRPGIIRPINNSSNSNDYGMLNNFIKIAWRNITNQKAFSFINISGLSLGLTCFVLIFLWVNDEMSVDSFHNENIYSAYQIVTANGETHGTYNTSVGYEEERNYIPIAEVEKTVPSIESIVFYATGYELPWGHAETFQIGDKKFKLNGSRASEDFFKVFNYPLLVGDPSTALTEYSSIAISRRMASLFFNSPEEAVGETIRYENRFDLEITAIFEDITPKSSLQFEFLINWESQLTRLDWASDNVRTMVKLAENADIAQVEADMTRVLKPFVDQEESIEVTIGLQPYEDQYLVGNFVNGQPNEGRILYVKIFSGVAIFILIIACINFTNLSTARAIRRAKEVGVRKVIGSTRTSLVGQFLSESFLMSFFAMLLSLALVWVLLPAFNELTGKQIRLPLFEWKHWLAVLALIVITGFTAGSYPALFLSSLKPVKVLKGALRFSRFETWFRKGLTTFQFGLSILLLIATAVVSLQTDHIQNTNLGYDKDNLLYIRVEGESSKQDSYQRFKDLASPLPGIAMVDRSSEAPHNMGFAMAEPFDWEGRPDGTYINFMPTSVGFDFLKIMDLEVVEGRGFSRDIATDSSDAFLVNEEAVRQMQMEEPLGKWVSAWSKKGKIIGILKDYHTHSLHEPIKPIMVDVKEYEEFGVILVRTKKGRTREAIENLEKVYATVNPSYPFNYQFIDQEYEALYKNEEVMSKLSNAFAIVAIMISCLGLLGLAMFSAEQRFKEIGIRKVLGASIASIVTLFSKDFMAIVGFSFLLAAPIGWWFLSDWLQGFAYRIDLSWWIFISAGLGAVVVGFLTISFQSIKTAMSNPIDAIKNE